MFACVSGWMGSVAFACVYLYMRRYVCVGVFDICFMFVSKRIGYVLRIVLFGHICVFLLGMYVIL